MNVKAQKNESDDKNSRHRNSQTDKYIRPHSQILFVKDVEYAIGEHFNCSPRSVRQSFRYAGGENARFNQSGIKIFRCLQDGVVSHEIIGANSETFVNTIIN